MRFGNPDDLVKYKNKFTGEVVMVPQDPKTFIINNKEFTQIYDSKRGYLKIASDSIVKMK
jgi:hypothetical protein